MRCIARSASARWRRTIRTRLREPAISRSTLQHADSAVLAALSPGAQADFDEKVPVLRVDAADVIHGAGPAPVAHLLRAVKPADRLETGHLDGWPLAGVDHVAEAGVQLLVLARWLVGQVDRRMRFAPGPARVIGLARRRQHGLDAFPGLGHFVDEDIGDEQPAALELELQSGHRRWSSLVNS